MFIRTTQMTDIIYNAYIPITYIYSIEHIWLDTYMYVHEEIWGGGGAYVNHRYTSRTCKIYKYSHVVVEQSYKSKPFDYM